MAKPRSTPRRALDFYPTPAPVARVLYDFLKAQGLESSAAFLDPAAGNGALIHAGRDVWPEAHWSAIEIDPQHRDALELVAEDVVIDDALAVDWPRDTVIPSNPPFRLLDDFWRRIADHRAAYSTWCAVFHPVAWWSAEKRRGLVAKPDVILTLGWRPKFHEQAGPAHKPMQDFAWSVLAPVASPTTTWLRVERPAQAP